VKEAFEEEIINEKSVCIFDINYEKKDWNFYINKINS